MKWQFLGDVKRLLGVAAPRAGVGIGMWVMYDSQRSAYAELCGAARSSVGACGESRPSEQVLRLLVASGESVGHLGRGIHIVNNLGRKMPLYVAFVLPKQSPFASYPMENGYACFEIGDRSLSLAPFCRGVRSTLSYLKGYVHSVQLLQSFKPHLVLGTGGRASFPTTLAAALRGVPTVTVSNCVLNRTNRVLAHFVDRTCVADVESYQSLPKRRRRKSKITGVPLRPEAFSRVPRQQAKQKLGLDPLHPVVTFVGYTRGSPMFSRLTRQVISRLEGDNSIQFVVQHGDFPISVGTAVSCSHRVLARSYFKDILDVFSASDLVVCAAGETTLLELCARGTPSICISVPDTPFGSHVSKVVRTLCRYGAATHIPAWQLSAGELEKRIRTLLGNDARLRKMAASTSEVDLQDGTSRAVAVIEELLCERGIVRIGRRVECIARACSI